MQKKSLKYYLGLTFLATNLLLNGCGAEIKKDDSKSIEQQMFIKRNARFAKKVTATLTEEMEQQKIIEEATKKAIANYDLINNSIFQELTKANINWNSSVEAYEIEFRNDKYTFNVTIAEEKIIKYLIQKTKIDFVNINKIENTTLLKELATCPQIEEVHINNTALSNLNILGDFKQLKGLQIINCPNLKDINFVKNLTELQGIKMEGTLVSDISPLSNCENLERALLLCNEITNPETLGNLQKLKDIRLQYNDFTDINKLKCFIDKGLISKEVADMLVETIDEKYSIWSKDNYEELGKVLDITYYDSKGEYFVEVTDEEGLNCAYTLVESPLSFYDISSMLVNPQYLKVNNFPEDGSISSISHKEKYKGLTIYDSAITTLYTIDDFTGLTVLNVVDCPNLVEPFDLYYGFYGLNDLTSVSFENTGIKNFDVLTRATALESVDLKRNAVESYEFLKDIRRLNTVLISPDASDISIDDELIQSLVDKDIDITIYCEPENLKEQKVDSEKKLIHGM